MPGHILVLTALINIISIYLNTDRMILKGSILKCADNSGCGTIKVIQLYSNNISHAGELIRGVMHKFNPNRSKLQKKKHYTVLCVGVKQPTLRKSALSVRLDTNRIVTVSDNRKKLLGTRVLGAVQREIRRMKIDVSIIHRIVLYSRKVI